MKLISNAKSGEPVESGTIFRVNVGSLNVCIHKIHGLSAWYLNCYELGIKDLPLKTQSLFECVDVAKEIIKYKLETINASFSDFYEDKEIEISRY